MAQTPLLQVKDLTVAFYTKDGVVRAVSGISYMLDQGETLGIVGESGSGKSVSVLSMLRLIPQPPGKILGGEVWFEGRDLLKIKNAEMAHVRGGKIAIIFQDPMTSLNPVMTIGDQIAEAIQVNLKHGPREARKRTIDVLSQVGIPRSADRLGDYPHQFSGGMRQRVMIAMAISCRPKLLIADEPTTSLDVTVQAQIIELVKGLQAELNMAVIWITHDLGVVARLTKRLIVMYAGHIVESGPIKPVFHDPAHPYTLGLLGSVPKTATRPDEELHFIDGSPPDMIHLPPGCPFSPRCIYRIDVCDEQRPELALVGENRQAACWNIQATGHRPAVQPAEAEERKYD